MKYDKTIASVFAGLTILFIAVALNSQSFFEWVFERHHNQLSWYVRPLFLIPFCYFAYKRSWTGVMITIFALFTSMFWFSKPEVVNEQVVSFLQYEKEWLSKSWESRDVLMALTVPFSFFMLALAFWKRSLWMGLTVVVLMATGKILWSIQNAGESGKLIVVPAILGLAVCFGLILYGFKRLEQKK